jgi:hypothetical protein
MIPLDRVVDALEDLNDFEYDDIAKEILGLKSKSPAPAPTIIRTVEELEALDSDTLVLDAAGYTVRYGSQVGRWDLPLAIVREGAEVRAARKALEEA